jgi:hypothetical protein
VADASTIAAANSAQLASPSSTKWYVPLSPLSLLDPQRYPHERLGQVGAAAALIRHDPDLYPALAGEAQHGLQDFRVMGADHPGRSHDNVARVSGPDRLLAGFL